MAAPRYGTHPPSQLPLLQLGGGSTVRLLAGALGEAAGPFKAAADVQIADYALAPGTSVEHALAPSHDNCLVYCYRGAAVVGGAPLPSGHVARLDMASAAAAAAQPRTVQLTSSEAAETGLLVFAGRMLQQPIAWHGPFVMTTQAEIRSTLDEYRNGTLLKVRAPWDFTKAAAAPK
jgi:redox-sensitive bicupin YhaK (pirin superfamily)